MAVQRLYFMYHCTTHRSVVAPERCLLSKSGRWLPVGREITWKLYLDRPTSLIIFEDNSSTSFFPPPVSLPHTIMSTLTPSRPQLYALSGASLLRVLWSWQHPSTCETGIHPSVPCPWWADSRSQPPAGHIVTVAKSGRIYPLKPVSTSANWRSHWTGPSPEVTGQGGTGHWVLQRVSAYLNFHSWLQ